jgi:hypothetical protein
VTVVFTAANASVTAQPQDIISSALTEAGIQNPQEPIDADMAAWGLEKLQRLIDLINAKRSLIYNVNFPLFNLQANHAPHTIGPGGDFNVPLRPVKVVGASFVLNSASSNPVDTPINIRDDDWWNANPLKSLTSSIVTDLFYSPDTPLGTLNFYPICNVASPVRLELWVGLAQAISLQASIGLPAAYWDFIVLSLAVRLSPSYGKEASPTLIGLLKEAAKGVLDNNSGPPRIDTNSGMPGSPGNGRPDFNFLTGLRE